MGSGGGHHWLALLRSDGWERLVEMAVKQTRELLRCPSTLSGQGAADTQLGWGPMVRMRGEAGAIGAAPGLRGQAYRMVGGTSTSGSPPKQLPS